jgi:hypothetical protein
VKVPTHSALACWTQQCEASSMKLCLERGDVWPYSGYEVLVELALELSADCAALETPQVDSNSAAYWYSKAAKFSV